MRRILTTVVMVILFVPMFQVLMPPAKAGGSETTIFQDNFESYAVGTFPSAGGWQLIYNGAGNQYQVITIDYSRSGSKSLQMMGQYSWSAVVVKDFSSSSNLIGFEAYLMGTPGSGPTVGFGNETIQPWGRMYGAVCVDTVAGYIRTASQNLQACVANSWYKIRTLMDRNARTFNVWIDDQIRGSNIPEPNDPWEIQSLRFDVGWANVKNYYDDVKVFSARANADWPMFRHDQEHTGYSPSKAPSTNNTIWKFSTDGEIFSSPAITNNRVYVGSDDHRIYCLDAENGTQIWNYTTGGVFHESSPAVFDNRVYMGSTDKQVYCLNASTGTLVWNYTTGGSVISSPAVLGQSLYVGSNDDKVYCLNASTGQHVWNYSTGDSVISSPAIAEGRVYVQSRDNKVYCLNMSTGAHLWNSSTFGTVPSESSPAVEQSMVYVGSDYGNVLCLNGSTGEYMWSFKTGPTESSPAVAQGKLYIGAKDGKIYCLNATSGTSIWNYTTGAETNCCPAVADNKVYVGSSNGRIFCLNASTGGCIWSYQTGGPIVSSPGIAYGKMYVGSSDRKLYAFGDRNVAVRDLVTSKNGCLPMETVGQNCTCRVNVTAQNEGNTVESFNVTVYATNKTLSLAIGRFAVILDPGKNTTLTSLWNTTTFAKGNYTISAVADIVPNESDPNDNVLTDGEVAVTMIGDVNADGKVDLKDVYAVGRAFGTTRQGPNPSGRVYSPNCDINGDDKIDLKDYYTTCKNYGKSW